jgi:glucokinase
MKMVYIGIDLGGSSISAGLVDKEMIHFLKEKTPADAAGIQSVLKKLVGELLVFADSQGMQVKGIGIGSPGPLDKENGMILNTPNLPQNMELRKPLQEVFPLPIIIENDANCFGLAEAHFGAGVGKRFVGGFTLGTGVGTCFLMDKKLFLGRGNATEFGHSTLKFDDNAGLDGRRGSVEYYLGKEAQLRYIKEAGFGTMRPREVHDLASQGDVQASEVFKEYGKYLGIAIANFANTLDPEIVVLGGGAANSFAFFKETMFAEMKDRLIVEPVEVVASNLKHPGVLGAAALFM